MDIYFVTGNLHKVEEAKIALRGSNINVHLLDIKKIEPAEWTLEEVAKNNAQRIAQENGKNVIVDDTGVFFEAFDGFPGNQPKRWFEKLGYFGLLEKFLKPKEIFNRHAYFQTVLGYCEPGKKPKLFTGELHGLIAKGVEGLDIDVMPYERIFICSDGRYLYEYSREEKDRISHRAKAFHGLREYLVGKRK